MSATRKQNLQVRPQAGRCCACGYTGEEESECPGYYDYAHCNHWWDGEDESDPPAAHPHHEDRNA